MNVTTRICSVGDLWPSVIGAADGQLSYRAEDMDTYSIWGGGVEERGRSGPGERTAGAISDNDNATVVGATPLVAPLQHLGAGP